MRRFVAIAGVMALAGSGALIGTIESVGAGLPAPPVVVPSGSPTVSPVVFDGCGPATWVVPAGVTSVTLQVSGAQGGAAGDNTGGLGGTATATFAVTPGESLTLFVGCDPDQSETSWGFTFGGGAGSAASDNSGADGGGSSAVVRSSVMQACGNPCVPPPLVVAGGGGGAGYGGPDLGVGGSGGGGNESGTDGGNGASSSDVCESATGGGGGTADPGGSHGTGGDASGGASNGSAGNDFGGGSGGGAGSFGGGGGGAGYYSGGGGGGAEGDCDGAGGGGGSGFVDASATAVTSVSSSGFNATAVGARAGNGRIVISWVIAIPKPIDFAG